MGRPATRQGEKADKERERLRIHYDKKKIDYKLRYLTRAYDIDEEELIDMTPEEKYRYCQMIKYERRVQRILNKLSTTNIPQRGGGDGGIPPVEGF